jgi:hypothetical protein
VPVTQRRWTGTHSRAVRSLMGAPSGNWLILAHAASRSSSLLKRRDRRADPSPDTLAAALTTVRGLFATRVTTGVRIRSRACGQSGQRGLRRRTIDLHGGMANEERRSVRTLALACGQSRRSRRRHRPALLSKGVVAVPGKELSMTYRRVPPGRPDRIAGLEVYFGGAGKVQALGRARYQVHLDPGARLVPHRRVLEAIDVRVGAQVAIDSHESRRADRRRRAAGGGPVSPCRRRPAARRPAGYCL